MTTTTTTTSSGTVTTVTNTQGQIVSVESLDLSGYSVTTIYDTSGTQLWYQQITTANPAGTVLSVEVDNRDGSRTAAGFDSNGNPAWDMTQAADGSGNFSTVSGAVVQFDSD